MVGKVDVVRIPVAVEVQKGLPFHPQGLLGAGKGMQCRLPIPSPALHVLV